MATYRVQDLEAAVLEAAPELDRDELESLAEARRQWAEWMGEDLGEEG